MSVNALIAQGGANVASPVSKYMQMRKQMNQERLNALSERSTVQQMGARAQQMRHDEQSQNILQQEQAIKGLASLGQYLDSVPAEQRKQVFEQSKDKFPEFGLPPLPEGVTYEQVAPGIEQAKIQVYGVDKGDRKNALYRGEVVPAIENEQGHLIDPKTGQRMPGATIAPTRQETGEAGAFGGLGKTVVNKEQDRAIQAREAVTVAHTTLGDLIEKAQTSDEYVGGAGGFLVKAANSARQQIRDMTGIEDVVVDGKLNSGALGKLNRENMDWLRKTAMETDTLDAGIRDFAFVLAKARDPGGKLSDRDILEAKAALESSDRAIMIQKLNEMDKRLITEYSAKRESRKPYSSYEYWKPLEFEAYADQKTGTAAVAPQASQEAQQGVDKLFESGW